MSTYSVSRIDSIANFHYPDFLVLTIKVQKARIVKIFYSTSLYPGTWSIIINLDLTTQTFLSVFVMLFKYIFRLPVSGLLYLKNLLHSFICLEHKCFSRPLIIN